MLGQHEQALECYQKSLDIRIRVVGSNHPLVADSYQNLAVLYRKQGNQAQAQEMASKAYHINLNVINRGPEHPQTKQLKSFLRL